MSTNVIKGKRIVMTSRDGSLNEEIELTSGQNEGLVINNVKTIGGFADTITVNASMVVSGSVSGGAAGNNTEIQYNSSGSLGASSNLTFDTDTLSVNNTVESPADLNLNSGEATTTTGNGFDVNITGGAGGSTNGDGGSLNLVCGTTFGGNSTGGSIALTAGDSQGSSNGGGITITGGDSLSGSGDGGNITLTPGLNSGGAGSDGTVIISSNMTVDNTITGASSLNLNSAAASNINMTSGAGITMSTGANSGITMTTGSGSGGNGGDFIFIGGTGGTTGTGADISLNAGTGGSTSGRGGSIGITGGNSSAGNSDGGDITITPGTATGTGADGRVTISGPIDTSMPYFYMETTNAQTVTLAFTKLTTAFNTTGTSSGYAPPTHAATTGDVVINDDGRYLIVVNLVFVGPTTINIGSGITLNGSTHYLNYVQYIDCTNTGSAAQNFSAIVDLVSGDVISIYARSGTDRTVIATVITAPCFIAISKIA